MERVLRVKVDRVVEDSDISPFGGDSKGVAASGCVSVGATVVILLCHDSELLWR